MVEKKRVLFTTAYRKIKDSVDLFEFGTTSSLFRFTFPRVSSYGLRFIKQNVPSIEILEYPSWQEYVKKIDEGWDIVGFSFYLNDTPETLEMIEYARAHGVKEIWGGNYGVLTDEIPDHFDRVFYGYAEEEIAECLGETIDSLIHPPLINYIGMPLGLKVNPVGIIFSTRGCPLSCSFCQGPVFVKNTQLLSLSTIERVIRYYKSLGITEITIADESFGLFPDHCSKVVDLLDRYNCNWTALTRVDLIQKNFEQWKEKGLHCSLLGIESFNQKTLDKISKNEKVDSTIKLVEKMHASNLLTIGYYIIGFEDDTYESIKKDILKLKELNLLLTHVNVLVPLPKTKQWDEITKKYGIAETNFQRFDGTDLVFNHPNLSREEIDELLKWATATLYPDKKLIDMVFRLIARYKDANNGYARGLWYMLMQIVKASQFDFSKENAKMFKSSDCKSLSVENIYRS